MFSCHRDQRETLIFASGPAAIIIIMIEMGFVSTVQIKKKKKPGNLGVHSVSECVLRLTAES